MCAYWVSVGGARLLAIRGWCAPSMSLLICNLIRLKVYDMYSSSFV